MTKPTREKFLADTHARYKEIGIRKNPNGHALQGDIIRYRNAASGKDNSTEAKTALKEVSKFINILKTYNLKRTTDFLYWEFAYQMHVLDSEKPKKTHAVVQSDIESDSDSESESEDDSKSASRSASKSKSKSASRSASRSPKSSKYKSKSASRSASRSPKSPKPRSKSASRSASRTPKSPKPKSKKSPQLVQSASRSASRSPLRPPVRSFPPPKSPLRATSPPRSPRHPSPGPSKKKSVKKVAVKSGYKERYQPFMDTGVVSKGVWGPYPSPNYLSF